MTVVDAKAQHEAQRPCVLAGLRFFFQSKADGSMGLKDVGFCSRKAGDAAQVGCTDCAQHEASQATSWSHSRHSRAPWQQPVLSWKATSRLRGTCSLCTCFSRRSWRQAPPLSSQQSHSHQPALHGHRRRWRGHTFRHAAKEASSNTVGASHSECSSRSSQ